MENKIRVEIKNIYGHNMIYPVCEKGKIFCRLIGKKTITESDKMDIEKLGYTFEIVPPVFGVK